MPVFRRMIVISLILAVVLAGVMLAGISAGSGDIPIRAAVQAIINPKPDNAVADIVWKIRIPRVLSAALAGAGLSLGGLVFQTLLGNPLAEPYILGISGGSAVGAIVAILIGLSWFPGVSVCSFLGSLLILAMVMLITSGNLRFNKESLLLSGVMLNAFCSALIMFLISLAHDWKLHTVMFWLMGDLSSADIRKAGMLAVSILPCFGILFCLSHTMNVLLMGKDMAKTTGVSVVAVTLILLITTSLMVSAVVCCCGLLGFVGLVMPHLLRLTAGPDHRILIPACILGGAAYMTACDLIARILPGQGELPTGVVTAMIGAPVFIMLLRHGRKTT